MHPDHKSKTAADFLELQGNIKSNDTHYKMVALCIAGF